MAERTSWFSAAARAKRRNKRETEPLGAHLKRKAFIFSLKWDAQGNRKPPEQVVIGKIPNSQEKKEK